MTENLRPPNPWYAWEYTLPMCGQQLKVLIPAPGGVIDPLDAKDALDLFALIARRLQAAADASHEPPPHGRG